MRQKTMIDKPRLIKAIEDVEGGPCPPSTQTELYVRVAKELGTTPGTVLGRIKDYQIAIKTPKGKKGRVATGRNKVILDVTEFVKLGLTIRRIEDLIVGPHNTPEINAALKKGWDILANH